MKQFNQEMDAFFQSLYPGQGRVLVFGEGVERARIALVGVAPGAQETLMGHPFVGKAGKNLDEFLQKTGFERKELYITNTVKFRPVKISKAGRVVNRPPTREEIELFLPFLRKELQVVAPECVVTMGNTALQALMGREYVVGDAHGRFFKSGEFTIFPIYHPASLIYNRSLANVYERDLSLLASWRNAK